MSGDFTEIFGGNNIASANPTYLALPMAADVTLEWPIEQALSGLVVASIIDVSASAPGLNIHLPDATQASEGFVSLINNVGANTVNILDSTGGAIVSIVSGTVWQIYLTDNSVAAGVWRVFQFGASVSVAVASALAGAGLTAIATRLALNMVVVPQNANYIIVDADRAKVEQWTSGVGQFTLPNPATVGAGWFVSVKNSGSGNLTVVPGAGQIDAQANAVYAPGASACIVTDGANFFTIYAGGTSGGGSGFNLITINAAGSGNLVLAGAQLNQIGYRFTGVLTGNRHIIVPGTAQEYWVDNETTGAFTLDVGTAGQVAPAPVVVQQGNRTITYCDGTNVVAADSSTVSFPISVANGGTGATTAAGARTNLGATAVGVSVFTAASVAAAQAALSVPPTSRLINTGTGLLGGGDLSADRTLSLDALNTTGTYVVKPADTARASVTVLAADPDLTFAMTAGNVYEVEMALGATSGGSGILDLAMFYTGATYQPSAVGALAGSTSVKVMNINPAVGGISAATADGNVFFVKFVFFPTANGSLTLQWAQTVSDPTPTVLKKGSYLKVRKLI